MSCVSPAVWVEQITRSAVGLGYRGISSDEWFRSSQKSSPIHIPPSTASTSSLNVEDIPSTLSPNSASGSPSSVFDFYAFRDLCANKKQSNQQAPANEPAVEVVLGFAVPSSTIRSADPEQLVSKLSTSSSNSSGLSDVPPPAGHGLLSQLIKDQAERHQPRIHNFKVFPGVRRCLAPPAKGQPTAQIFQPAPKLHGQTQHDAPHQPPHLKQLPPHTTTKQACLAASCNNQASLNTPNTTKATPQSVLNGLTQCSEPDQSTTVSYDSEACSDSLLSHRKRMGPSAQERALPSIDQILFSGLSQHSLDILEDKWREYCMQGGSYQDNVTKLMSDISAARRAEETARRPAHPPHQKTDCRTKWWHPSGPGFLHAVAPTQGRTAGLQLRGRPGARLAFSKVMDFFRA